MRNRIAFFSIFVIGLLWCAAGCGAPGIPMPPSLELPRPVDDLAAVRKGGRVVLTWTAPTADDGSAEHTAARADPDLPLGGRVSDEGMPGRKAVASGGFALFGRRAPAGVRRSCSRMRWAGDAERDAIRHLCRRGPEPAREERGAFQSGAGFVGSVAAGSRQSARRGHGRIGGPQLDSA